MEHGKTKPLITYAGKRKRGAQFPVNKYPLQLAEIDQDWADTVSLDLMSVPSDIIHCILDMLPHRDVAAYACASWACFAEVSHWKPMSNFSRRICTDRRICNVPMSMSDKNLVMYGGMPRDCVRSHMQTAVRQEDGVYADAAIAYTFMLRAKMMYKNGMREASFSDTQRLSCTRHGVDPAFASVVSGLGVYSAICAAAFFRTAELWGHGLSAILQAEPGHPPAITSVPTWSKRTDRVPVAVVFVGYKNYRAWIVIYGPRRYTGNPGYARSGTMSSVLLDAEGKKDRLSRVSGTSSLRESMYFLPYGPYDLQGELTFEHVTSVKPGGLETTWVARTLRPTHGLLHAMGLDPIEHGGQIACEPPC